MHRSILSGQTETKFDCVLGRTTAKIVERRLQTRVFKLRLGKVHSPRASLIRQRHIRVSSQMINIPFLLVRTDSEKHIDFALTHRARRMKGALSANDLDEQALSIFAGTLARRPETKKRRHDAAIRKWSIRLCEVEK